ncbi:unnamed protein product [Clonostachys rosea]|uniref:Uncharacterized protein n=1 Tax=Bionectria ochroleuca TaxID=29856 RepID=A0ABY6UXP2_BIOOC|nr:unnamed protein product [Clonostachys rosea]
MDARQFASDPFDPSWEKPTYRSQHIIDVTPGRLRPARYDPKDRSERAKLLYSITSDFARLCNANLSVSSIDKFLADWRDGSGRIQPNILAWLDDTDVVTKAIWHSKELLLYLLQSGFKPNSDSISEAVCLDFEIPENMDIFQLLIDSVLDNRQLVEWCLSKGADPNASSLSSKSIMQRAAFYAPLDTIKLLVEKGASLTNDVDLIAYASYGHTTGPGRKEVISYFLQNGLSIDTYLTEKDDHIFQLVGRQNALHLAIMGGKKDMVEFLVENGADRSLKVATRYTDGEELSPAEFARLYKEESIAQLLD